MNNLFKLNSGNVVDLKNLDPNLFTIYDIANGLSKICRYAGAGNEFYSVAEHSVLLADIMPDKESAQQALLHDASEIFTGDMPYGFKTMFPETKTKEIEYQKIIATKFNTKYPYNDIVNEYDLRICVDEAEQLEIGSDHMGIDKGLDVELKFLNPNEAKELFLDRFNKLFN